MSNNSKEVLSERDLQAATSSTDSRWLAGAGPLLKRGVEGSDEKSDTTSSQITGSRSNRICLETAAYTVEKDLSHNRPRSTTSSESQTEDSRQFLTSVEGVDYSIANNLHKCGDDVDALLLLSNLDPRAPLCTAVKNKHYPVAELLITFKADANALDEDGKPPLYYAIENGDGKMTTLLLNNGAKVETFLELLHLATSKENVEIVETLLQQGVDVNLRNKVGNTVLYFAVSTACEAILKSDSATETDTTNNASIYNEFIDMFDLLLKSNANVNSANDEGSTPLHSSARNGNVEISTLLLNKGANIDAEDEYRNTPLHLAVTEGHVDIVKLLVERGAKTNCYNLSFVSPLHFACERGHTRIVEILLDFGGCADSKTSYSGTPLHFAATEDHEDVVKLLLDRGAQANLANRIGVAPLHIAAEGGKTGMIDTLLASGACINARTWEGESPLSYAVYYHHAEAVRLLLERGAQVNCRDEDGRTPLMLATYYDSEEIIKILLRFGACVNSRIDDDKTALHVASGTGKASAVATLLDNGADDSMKCKESYTPFNYAWGLDSAFESRGEYYQNIDRNMLHGQHDTIDAFFRHQVKMEAAGLNPTASSDGGLEYFYLECQLEVARMESSFIATNVSYFDIMKKGSKCVAKCLKNKSIVLALESEDYEGEFPIYAGIIGFKFREGLARKKLLERATCVFQRITGWPEDCTAKVLDFLDDDTLKVFLEV